MSFTNPKPLGYSTGDLIDESEINYWTSILPDCIDGAGGGTYTLSAPLIINGDEVDIDTLFVTGTGGLTVNHAMYVAGDVTLGSNVLSDTLTVTAEANLEGDLIVSGSTNLGGLLAVTGITGFTGAVTIESTLGYAGASGRVLQTGIIVNAALQSVSGVQYRHIVITYASTTTTTITGTFVDGDMVRIYNRSGVSQGIAGAPMTGSISSGSSLTLLRISGSWEIVGD